MKKEYFYSIVMIVLLLLGVLWLSHGIVSASLCVVAVILFLAIVSCVAYVGIMYCEHIKDDDE